MTRAKKATARRKVRAATQEQRNAVKFEAPLLGDNETWALTFLPRVRMAMLFLKDDKGCGEKMASFVKLDLASEVMEGWEDTKAHLEDLAALCDIALSRGFIELERLGYSHPPLPCPQRQLS